MSMKKVFTSEVFLCVPFRRDRPLLGTIQLSIAFNIAVLDCLPGGSIEELIPPPIKCM